MPKWFRAKRAGVGFAPNTVAGWVITAILVALVLLASRILPRHSYISLATIFGLVIAYIAIALLTLDREK